MGILLMITKTETTIPEIRNMHKCYDYKSIIHAKLRLTKVQRQEKSCIYVSYGMMTFITFAKEDNEVPYKNN